MRGVGDAVLVVPCLSGGAALAAGRRRRVRVRGGGRGEEGVGEPIGGTDELGLGVDAVGPLLLGAGGEGERVAGRDGAQGGGGEGGELDGQPGEEVRLGGYAGRHEEVALVGVVADQQAEAVEGAGGLEARRRQRGDVGAVRDGEEVPHPRGGELAHLVVCGLEGARVL